MTKKYRVNPYNIGIYIQCISTCFQNSNKKNRCEKAFLCKILNKAFCAIQSLPNSLTVGLFSNKRVTN